jgi:hypothetical protein
LWIGNAAWLEAQRVLGTFTVPRTLEDFVAPLDSLRGDLEAVGWTVDERRRGDGREVVLLRRR